MAAEGDDGVGGMVTMYFCGEAGRKKPFWLQKKVYSTIDLDSYAEIEGRK
jgi:hypothetical protein